MATEPANLFGSRNCARFRLEYAQASAALALAWKRSLISSGATVAPEAFSLHGGKMEKATFGAGCFWGVEETFRRIQGVTDAAVGYAGGKTQEPTYEDVCSHTTGHAEVVEVEFDPTKVSYAELLTVFWSNHDPTTVNRQGPDVGDQYRSVIFYHSPEQREAAEESKAELDKSGRFRRPIVTQIEPAPKFYRAEEYHQRYLEKRGLSHCAI